MIQVFINILIILFLVVVCICIWKTVEYFSTLPESNKWRMVLAWDTLVMFILAIILISRIATG